MKNVFVVMLTVLVAPFAMAGKGETKAAVCHFTEPFISVYLDKEGRKYQIVEKSLSDTGSDQSKQPINFSVIETSKTLTVTYGHLVAQPNSPNFNVEKTTLTIDKTKEGNDGMSDEVFQWTGTLELTPNFTVVGGCNPK